MSNTRIQKENIKYMKGLINNPSIKLRRQWDRFNFDQGYERNLRNKEYLKAIELVDNEEC